MGEDDKLLGEIHASVKILDRRMERVENKLDGMTTSGCAKGTDNEKRITRHDKLIATLFVLLAGGGGGVGIAKLVQALVP